MRAVTVCIVGLIVAAAVEASTLDVPLVVWDVAGVARSGEVCSTGVPLPCGLVKEADGLAVFDGSGKTVAAQFRVLERWCDVGEQKGDGSIRWVLVTFLADVPAGGKAEYRLRAGENPAPEAAVKIEEKGDGFEMGGLLFKKDFSGPFELVLTDSDGKEVRAAELPIKWSIWEAGPVRGCLKAETPTVAGKFGFIAWVYAYAGDGPGAGRWDMTVVLKNTPVEGRGPFYFKDFSVVWSPGQVAGARDFALGGQWGQAVAGKVEGNGAAYVMQASDGTDKWNAAEGNNTMVMDWTKELSKAKTAIGEFRGYKVLSGGKELGAGNYAAGWAVLNSEKAAAFAAVRDFYPQYPKATEVQAGRIVLRLWPKYSKSFSGIHWLDDSTRKWHDVLFRLVSAPMTAAEAEAASKCVDYPLVAHAAGGWCAAAGAYSSSPERPERAFAGNVIKLQPGTGRNWVTYGGDITDRIRRRYHGADLSGFARTGDPAQAYQLYKTARHSSGMTPLWLDEYEYPRDSKKLTHAQYCGLARGAGNYRANTWHYGFCSWNDAHFCCQEVFDGWRLFGDPLALEALTTIGRWCQAYVDFREGGGGLVAGTRADGFPLHNLGEAYRILGDGSMRKSLDRFGEVCWKQVNKQRGNYGVMAEWEGGKDLCEKPFMMAQVMKGLRAHYELTGSERTADEIYGMADFILAESSIGPWGFKYVVMIDVEKNKSHLVEQRQAADKDGQHVSYGDLSWVMAWVYRHFGDERFRAAVDGLSKKAYPHVAWAYTGYYPEPMDRTAPEAVKDLAAEALGGGKVRLTWTAPAGEPVRYQVKWAEREMVERLGYPEEKETKANWWAAAHVEGEPKPAGAGAKESMVAEGVATGTRWFAVRSFDGASNRSGMSNVVAVEVK